MIPGLYYRTPTVCSIDINVLVKHAQGQKRGGMRISVGNTILYASLFADDQIFIVSKIRYSMNIGKTCYIIGEVYEK